KADNDQLDVLLGLGGHVPNTSQLAVLRRCVARVKERLADLDDKIIALEAENFTPSAAISRFSYTRATLSYGSSLATEADGRLTREETIAVTYLPRITRWMIVYDEIVPSAPLFRTLDEDSTSAVLDSMRPIVLPRGRHLFEEHDPGDSLFLIAAGKMKIGL